MKRTIIAAVMLLCTACTPEQLAWWRDAEPDTRAAVMEHIIRDAADEFGVDPDLAVAIARCESGLRAEAKNPTSSASGLFQQLAVPYWPGRAAALGYPEDTSPFDPTANARVSAWMMSTQGTSPWNPSRHCWSSHAG